MYKVMYIFSGRPPGCLRDEAKCDNDPMPIENEIEFRRTAWQLLKENGGTESALPADIRALGAFGGGQGIWVDKTRTAELTVDGLGVAVGLLQTQSDYPDSMFDGGMIYEYPDTDRPKTRDDNEIAAMKNAMDLRLPVFVVARETPSSNHRRVRLAWIIDCDDQSRCALVEFGEVEPESIPGPETETTLPFELTEATDYVETQSIRRPHRFRYLVQRRYQGRCAFTGISDKRLLDAAHIRGKSDGGCDDPRNGLLISPTVHRAFDGNLIAIEPSTLVVTDASGGALLETLGIHADCISNLTSKPHPDALAWRWETLGPPRP